MKESFGSTILLTIMMIFVILLVSFTAVIANIAKTFRIKNQIINYVEQYNYDGKAGSEAIKKINEFLPNAAYQKVEGNGPDKLKESCTTSNGYWDESFGYCIIPNVAKNPEYFKVIVYSTVSLPFFNISLSLPISGETKSYQTLGS